MEGLPFDYHWRCKKIRITHLCFADDLMIFCEGSLQSVELLQQSLQEFYALSGLLPNKGKSCIFIAGRNQSYMKAVRDILDFPLGELPVRYLGVPLISSKMGASHCKPLVDCITFRATSWTAIFLSFVGRLQLIKSILCSIQSFWNGLFILPKKVIRQVEQVLRRFLWKGPQLGPGGAKVAWDDLTHPLDGRWTWHQKVS